MAKTKTPAPDQAIYTLRQQGQGKKDIAQQLGMSKNTIKADYFECRLT